MDYKEYHYKWEWGLAANPAALWPLMSDTPRFNRDIGLPKLKELTPDNLYPAGTRLLRFSKFGIPVEWVEEPFEWVQPNRFGVVRRYKSGPFKKVIISVRLEPNNEGTHLIYEIRVRPSNLLGIIVIPIQIGFLLAKKIDRIIHRYDKIASRNESLLMDSDHVKLSSGGKKRLAVLREKLLSEVKRTEIVSKLVATIMHADDLTLSRIRAYRLADLWSEPRNAVLELCLRATRLGLLDSRWTILCPHCRGPKKESATLNEIDSEVYCASCNIDFKVNFDTLVEITFKTNPAIRKIDIPCFCVGGPLVTPHIKVQQLIKPNEAREIIPELKPGWYTMRTRDLRGGQKILIKDVGPDLINIKINVSGWPENDLSAASNSRIRLVNNTSDDQLFILEQFDWDEGSSTAAEVTALQVFRDLFGNEALKPGKEISVGSLTVLFTDLRDSTRLYENIGDAHAFGVVMDHFKVLRECIAESDGAIIKTIGDAVMAVFYRPANALRAMLNAQKMLANPPTGTQPLILKAGIHYGHCIAVTLNNKLDYFGRTINLASRLEKLSSGKEVIITEEVMADPEVKEMLADENNGLKAEYFETTLKGFEEERCRAWKITINSLGARSSI